jgi:hypothetical protein
VRNFDIIFDKFFFQKDFDGMSLGTFLFGLLPKGIGFLLLSFRWITHFDTYVANYHFQQW